ncbi:Uncharacterized conserved protein, contains NRDE domain [Polaromonas sp. OV174]|uniref:NRDE family protein n=1 Tax=Polaromonas sp. OV174 TaxID=1855300 RepID=UPI0008F0BBFA|nr:NRDE family protein [Polaromonas sp. OV174]SFC23957.1 Uncharacterized conserved protein, contains NRDE domain [Polaromonas sp. OV174]
MCLIAFAINASARWPLVIAANRDEFLNRPTLPLARWQGPARQDIISGRDLRAGGTWLGMNPNGRVAFLTNVREGQALLAPRSRGELVTRWLEASGDADAFAQSLSKDAASYGGFNLIVGDFQHQAWTWLTNKPAGQATAAASPLQSQPLAPGVYGLSNASLNTPWPKTTALKEALALALHKPEEKALQASLWAALGNRERARPEQLPLTGVPLALEQALSSAFVDYPEHGYGTRSSTLLLVSEPGHSEGARRWEVSVEERSYGQTPRPDTTETAAAAVHGAQVSGIHRERFSWQPLTEAVKAS